MSTSGNYDNQYFQQALSAMVTNTAYADAVRHLYNRGFSVEEIQKNLDYPVSLETINSVINEYKKKEASTENEYEYIERQDQFGRRSFVRVKKDSYNS